MGTKTAGVGPFQIPTAPAALTVVAQSGSANTLGSAVSFGNAPSALYITGVHVGAATTQTPTYVQIQILVAASIVGSVIVAYGVSSAAANSVATGFRPIYPPIPVANGAAITVKSASSVASAVNWGVSLECIAQSNVVDDGIPITTVTTLTNLPAITANWLTAAGTAADFGTEVAAAVWQDAVAGDFTVASSIGKALYIANVAPGAAGGHFISGSNAGTTTVGALTVTGVTTYTGATVHTGNVSFVDGVTIAAPSTVDRAGLDITGNGAGAAMKLAAGATGKGIAVTTTAGDALSLLPTAGHAIVATGQGTTKHGAFFTGGGTTSNGVNITSASGDGLAVSSSGSNGNGISAAGNGSGHGTKTTGGATGHGLAGVGGATSGSGISAAATTAGSGINATGSTGAAGITATGGHGIDATSNANSGGHGIRAVGCSTFSGAAAGHGASFTGGAASSSVGGTAGRGISVVGGNGAATTNGAGPGLRLAGGNVTTVSGNSGLLAVATGSAPDIDGDITGNITGDITGSLSGSAGSVTGAVGSVAGNVGGNVAGSVASVLGNVGGNVVGSVASVAGNVGGNVVGSVDSVTDPVTVGTISANVINAASLAADAIAAIQAGLSTFDPTVDVLENGQTYEWWMRIWNSGIAGISNGFPVTPGAGTQNFRDAADTINRIVADTDGYGNRTAVALIGA